MRPSKYPIKYCKGTYCGGIKLVPQIDGVSGVEGSTKYFVSNWYCPKCGLMYYFPDLETITEVDE